MVYQKTNIILPVNYTSVFKKEEKKDYLSKEKCQMRWRVGVRWNFERVPVERTMSTEVWLSSGPDTWRTRRGAAMGCYWKVYLFLGLNRLYYFLKQFWVHSRTEQSTERSHMCPALPLMSAPAPSHRHPDPPNPQLSYQHSVCWSLLMNLCRHLMITRVQSLY